MKINIIVAHDMNRCIGKNNEIPWKIKGEQKQFKELTTGNIVIMGRKTYESIDKALPNRTNIIISRHNQHKIKDAICCKSLNEAILCAQRGYGIDISNINKSKDIYIIGGELIYHEAMEESCIPIDNYYITKIKTYVVGGDAFFPKFDESIYDKRLIEETDDYIRYIYSRKRG